MTVNADSPHRKYQSFKVLPMNFFKQVDFTQQVFFTAPDYPALDDIGCCQLGELAESCAEETCTPTGNAPKYHIRDEVELWTWGYMGNFPKLVYRFDSPEQAEHALKLTFLCDLEKSEVYYSNDRSEVVKYLQN